MILTVYVPVAPAVLWTLREIVAQRDSIHADGRGLPQVEAVWSQAFDSKLTRTHLVEQSNLVQDALFDARSRCPLVFNWVYQLLRKTQLEQMEFKARELVAEAIRKLLLQERQQDSSSGSDPESP